MKMVDVVSTVGDAVENAVSDLNALGEECREGHDNMPDSLQGSARGQALEEAADTLTGIEEPTIPEALGALPVTYQQFRQTKRLARAGRRDNATMALQAAKSALEAIDDKEEASELAEEIGNIIDEAEGVEFPGWGG